MSFSLFLVTIIIFMAFLIGALIGLAFLKIFNLYETLDFDEIDFKKEKK